MAFNRCPKCMSKMRVVDSRFDEDAIVRRYRCSKNKKHVFRSEEKMLDELSVGQCVVSAEEDEIPIPIPQPTRRVNRIK